MSSGQRKKCRKQLEPRAASLPGREREREKVEHAISALRVHVTNHPLSVGAAHCKRNAAFRY